jgi:hypothetical protein
VAKQPRLQFDKDNFEIIDTQNNPMMKLAPMSGGQPLTIINVDIISALGELFNVPPKNINKLGSNNKKYIEFINKLNEIQMLGIDQNAIRLLLDELTRLQLVRCEHQDPQKLIAIAISEKINVLNDILTLPKERIKYVIPTIIGYFRYKRKYLIINSFRNIIF